jgi:hypothetical protein
VIPALDGRAASRGRTGRFQLEAAIQSVHAERARSGAIQWNAIMMFYEQLIRISPTLGTRTGYAAAVAEAKGAEPGLAALDGIDADAISAYQPCRRSGEDGQALRRRSQLNHQKGIITCQHRFDPPINPMSFPQQIIPSYGQSLIENAALCQRLRAETGAILHINDIEHAAEDVAA